MIQGENIVYISGTQGFQSFKGLERLETGIKKRIRHSIKGVIQIHDTYLDPAIQEGHIHTAGYEAIMLQYGNIDALVWNQDEIKIFSLKKWGDLIVFLPRSQHSLIIKKKSRIIVIKNFVASSSKDKRRKVMLPASIESLREAVLKGEKKIVEASKEINEKLQ